MLGNLRLNMKTWRDKYSKSSAKISNEPTISGAKIYLRSPCIEQMFCICPLFQQCCVSILNFVSSFKTINRLQHGKSLLTLTRPGVCSLSLRFYCQNHRLSNVTKAQKTMKHPHVSKKTLKKIKYVLETL